MAHIELGVDEQAFPGIGGLLMFRPQTARPLGLLADALLHDPNTLSPGERELIAAYVSGRNECEFCCNSHSAIAAAQLDGGMPLVLHARDEPEASPVGPKMRALLRIAGAVQESGRDVTRQLVDDARAEGATDTEIHDTVLIAAAFCMFNRYVDGLGTLAPEDPALYEQAAKHIVAAGYSGLGSAAADA
ncbi:MAG TPA: carboxymuconolactone decarboxylase family protein [Actinocrinis sp.]|jgi:uncharacterized peroxidase-related enzyme